MRTAMSCLALVMFAAYWLTTLLFISPNNPIRIQFDDELTRFGAVCAQRWGFFAPPPTSNLRIYYAFFDKITGAQTSMIEAIGVVNDVKRSRGFFNADAELMDYLLASSALTIVETMNAQSSFTKVAFPKETETFYFQETLRVVNELRAAQPAYGTLVNYAAVLASQNHIDPLWHDVRVTITFESLPPLPAAGAPEEPSTAVEVALAFESPILPIPVL